MPDMTTTVAIVIVFALIVVFLIFVLTRGGRLKAFNLDVLKGFLKLGGTIDTGTDAGRIIREIGTGQVSEDDDARRIIQWLREEVPQTVKGCYVLTDSTQDNAQIAARLYTRLDGEIVATCFFESPHYGRADFASTIDEKASFSRLTAFDVCDDSVIPEAVKMLNGLLCKASLSVVPEQVEISRIGGIFAHLSDRSYLAFIAMNNAQDTASNKGLVFSGTLAEELFSYFKVFADTFRVK